SRSRYLHFLMSLRFLKGGEYLTLTLFRLAAEFQPAWYIDLHEARGFSKVNPKVLGQTLITNPKSGAIPLVKQIVAHMNRSIAKKSTHFSVRIRKLPGSGRTAAHRLLNSKAITVETSCNLPISVRVNYQIKILRYILNETGLIKDNDFVGHNNVEGLSQTTMA
ncbi:hypothetical protein NLX71_26180, partial [Paenibacillus sp. MZ04-78.2]|nr:hypothetical protein [Paenibacillus sp. MZ04-78.2]